MTTLATVPELRESLELSGRDREAAEVVASSLRDAKAENTHRSYASAWRRFRTWANDGGHPALPATPQAAGTDGISGNRPQARHKRAALDLAIIGVLGRRRAPALRGRGPDLGRRGTVGRRHRPPHHQEEQEPACAANRGGDRGHRPRPGGNPARGRRPRMDGAVIR